MLKLLLSLALVFAIPTPQVWAQVAAVRVAPAGAIPIRLAPPAPVLPPSGSLLPAAPLSASVLPTATVLPGPVLPVMPQPVLRAAAAAPAGPLPAHLAQAPAPASQQLAGAPPASVVLERVASAVSPAGAGSRASAPALRASFDGSALRAPGPDAVPVTASSPVRPRLAPYLGGTFFQQAANNAVHVSLPLAVLSAGGSLPTAAVVVAVAGWADALGTLLGGRLADRIHPLTLLRGVTAARAAALAAVPLLVASGAGLWTVGAAFLADALARGVADSARNTLPVAYAGKDRGELERFNGRFQTYFESGALAGPFLVGLLLTGFGAAAGQWLAPAALAFSVALYATSPKPAMPEADDAPAKAGWGAVKAHLLARPASLAAFVGLAALTLYPLRTVLPAVWATDVLGDPASAAWLVGAFGAGGLAGSLLFRAARGRVAPSAWLVVAAVGTAGLALAWLPGAFLPLAAGVAVFAAANAAARLSLTSVLQAGSPDGLAGGVMGASRFTVNLTAMGVKAAAAAALAVAAGSVPALGLVAGGMAVFGGVQLWSARRLATAAPAELSPLGRPSPRHGLPGRLIVVEGLDGSGKSTQLELLRERLESEGRDVVLTAWNSSGLVSEGVKRAKKDEDLTPRAFALAQAADLADRVEHTVLPALRAGKVVLADRWEFTGVARDTVRGSDRVWVERLYDFAPKPDLVLYYRAPVDTAVGRVLKRSGRASLSEDGDPDELEPSAPRVKFYEGGLDLALDADPVGNFKAFQARVTAVYDRLAAARGFRVLDASRGVPELAAETARLADSVLGAPRGAPPVNGVFDKDPAGDAENIRENYKNEKKGVHFYFRNMLLPMQERFAQLVEHGSLPNVFLHGNPHVDNYAKTLRGGSMADFDRSRRGPYAWDLARFLVSLSLRQKTPHHALLPKGVLKALLKGYRRGFEHPERGWEQMRELAGVTPEPWELTTDAYVAHGGKWMKELRESPLPNDDPRVLSLVAPYLDRYVVEEAGKGHGSMGFRDLVLVLLKPKGPGDRVLLNIKAVRSDPDTRWYRNPAPNDGERMLQAGALYAPGWEEGAARAELDGVEYYVRRIPPHNAKLKKLLDRDQLEDLAYAVGTQLGRGHRLSVAGEPGAVLADLGARFDDYVAAALTMRDEVAAAHRRYLKALRRLEEGR